jgi:hypothetical protein
MPMLLQVVSLLGAALLLGAFFANTRGWLNPRGRLYGVMNLVGALLLLWVAVADMRWGFIVLEVAWAAAALPAVVKPGGSPLLPEPREG